MTASLDAMRAAAGVREALTSFGWATRALDCAPRSVRRLGFSQIVILSKSRQAFGDEGFDLLSVFL